MFFGKIPREDDSVILMVAISYLLELPLHTEWRDFVNYPYEVFDFLIGMDGHLYFLEANAVGAGIYVLPIMHEALKYYIPGTPLVSNDKVIKSFVEGAIILHQNLFGYKPSTSIVTLPRRRKDLLNPEREAIAEMFRAFGIKSWLVIPDNLSYKDAMITAKMDGKEINPDIIIRRSFNFYKKVKQLVINPSEAGKVTINKWETYKLVENVIKKDEDIGNFLRVPDTVFAKSDDLIEKARDMLEKHDRIIIKPNKGTKGEGIFIIENLRDLEMLEAEEIKGNFIIQKLINSYPFPSSEGRFYSFDIRVYAFMGKIIGIQARRAPKPVSNNRMKENTVSNIHSGGALIYINAVENLDLVIDFVRAQKFKLRLADFYVDVDGTIILLNKGLYDILQKMVYEISKAISSAVYY